MVTIEKDSSQTCGELARQFYTSSETVRLHLHRLGDKLKLSSATAHEGQGQLCPSQSTLSISAPNGDHWVLRCMSRYLEGVSEAKPPVF
ncbi:hypothetical protein TNCV_988561 [Trichonephila clavipes]|nr:hypothetical protein TNCV_988561 [Trichonephila clavipes]